MNELCVNVYWTSCNVAVITVRIKTNLKFLDRFSKNIRMSNFTKIPEVGVELFPADGQTDMAMLKFAFRNFANAPRTKNRLRKIRYCRLER